MPRKKTTHFTPFKFFSSPLCSNLKLFELLNLFIQLTSVIKDIPLPDGRKRPFYKRLYTPAITLWGMILQRLMADHTLENTVDAFIDGKADRIKSSDNLPFSEKVKSSRTTSFSDARQELPLSFFQQVLLLLPSLLGKAIQGRDWKGWMPLLLDGSTVKLRAFPGIVQWFGRHSNKKDQGDWCVMRVVVGFCLRTGMALTCGVGPQNQSEQALACAMILALQAKTLIIGDSNFGVFSIVQCARESKAAVLMRMTPARAARLAGKAALRHALDLKVLWEHSRHDQLQPGCSAGPIEGRLIACRIHRRGHRSFTLYLFTTLLDEELYTVQELVELYGFRWHVELNLRYLKSEMDLSQLECKSAQMAKKEWYAGLIAYNLIRAMMLLAATKKGLDPLTLSFSGCQRIVCSTLLKWAERGKIDCEKVLESLARKRLPTRKKPRPNEPRMVRLVRRDFPPLRGNRDDARKKWAKSQMKS
jgi:IS4 transposase